MQGFKEKVAVVTGGASGIGREMGRQLAAAGATVVLADVNESLVAEAVAEIQWAKGKARSLVVDVRDGAAVRRMVDDAVQVHGRIDYLFNNAGIAVFGETQNLTDEDWTRLVDVNIRGVVHGVQAAYPVMIRQGFGHIVNTASIAGLAPAPGFSAYAMTKHAVVGLTKALRCEASRYGVKISAVCPGFVDTPLKANTEMRGLERQALLERNDLPFRPVQETVRDALQGVLANRTIIVVTGHARFIYLMYRAFPGLVELIAAGKTAKVLASGESVKADASVPGD